jgi:hypothetical protein
MTAKTQKAYAYSGLVMLVLMMVGFITAGWLPPPGPGQSATQVAHDYQTHATAIRVGLMFAIFGVAFLVPFVAVIAAQMKRIDGRGSLAAYCQLAFGTLFVIEFLIPFMVLEVAAYRPDRSPAVTLALSDLGWILLVAPVSTAVLELILVGIVIRGDQQAKPVFPRWLATFSFVVAAVFTLGAGAVFVTSGPFAWNGLLSFWLPLSAYGAWLLVMVALLVRAIDARAAESVGTPTTAVEADWEQRARRLSDELDALRVEVSQPTR